MADISLKRLFFNSGKYCITKWHEMSLFSIINAIFMIVGFKIMDSWHDRLFLLWILPYYVFWYYFFRFYFGRKPYIDNNIFGTLLPSSKILVLTLLIVGLLIIIPLLIPFVFGSCQWVETYIEHLQKYTEGDNVLDAGMLLILTLISPFIFYRPMMAWIGSVIGRSGQLSTAFSKTGGIYWELLLISVEFNLLFMVIEFFDTYFGLQGWLTILLDSPLMVFMNVLLAKMYEYIFLEIE